MHTLPVLAATASVGANACGQHGFQRQVGLHPMAATECSFCRLGTLTGIFQQCSGCNLVMLEGQLKQHDREKCSRDGSVRLENH